MVTRQNKAFSIAFIFIMIRPIQNRLTGWARDGRLYAVLAAAGFSMKAIFVKLGYAAGPVDALTLLALRMGFALPLFLWLIWLSNLRSGSQRIALTRADIGRIWLLACLGYYLSSLFDFHGLTYITAGLERLILYLYPTLVLLLQAWLTRKRPGARAWQAMMICYAGLAIAFFHDLDQSGHGVTVLTGAAWVFASAVTYALYYLGIGEMVGRIGSMRLAGLTGGASCVLVLAHFVLLGQPQSLAHLPLAVCLAVDRAADLVVVAGDQPPRRRPSGGGRHAGPGVHGVCRLAAVGRAAVGVAAGRIGTGNIRGDASEAGIECRQTGQRSKRRRTQNLNLNLSLNR
jgi:drug/metabolite transporter (DMT)-like permease